MAGDLPGNDHGNQPGGPDLVGSSADLKAFDAAVIARTASSLSFARALFEKMKVRAAEVMQKASSYYRDLLVDLNAYRLPVKGDRNEKAVRNMLNGLGSRDFEVRIIDGSKKLKAQSRYYSADQLADPKTLAFLRSKNAQGLDIYVRPKYPDKSGLVLVDDLHRGQIAELEMAGLKPAVLMQTSDQNFQAWIRINRGGFDREEHAGITRFINEQIGGDPASTDQEHFGRLVGFTNRKPKRVNDMGLPPYVRLESHDGRPAINGQWLLNEVRRSIDEAILAKHEADKEKVILEQSNKIKDGDFYPGFIKDSWFAIEKSMIDKGIKLDKSKIDYRVALRISRLNVPIDEAIQAFALELPDLDRKSDAEDYIRRTIVKAYAAVDNSKSDGLEK